MEKHRSIRLPDYYQVLQVPRHADRVMVRQAFLRLCKQHHQRLSWDSSPVLQDGFGLQSTRPGTMLESFSVRAGR